MDEYRSGRAYKHLDHKRIVDLIYLATFRLANEYDYCNWITMVVVPEEAEE